MNGNLLDRNNLEERNYGKKQNKVSVTKSIGNYIVYAIISIIVVACVASAMRYVHANNEFLTKGETLNLNEYIRDGKPLPIGEYVSLNVKFPLGAYATHTGSFSVYNAAFDSSKDYYYAVFLEDYTIMTLKLSRQEDIDALDADASKLGKTLNFLGADMILKFNMGGKHTVSGKLVNMENSELLSMYKDMVKSIGGKPDSEVVRYIVLDTTAVRVQNVLIYIVAPIAGFIILLVVILLVRHRRKKDETIERENTPSPDKIIQ